MPFDRLLYKQRIKVLYTSINANTDETLSNDAVIENVAEVLSQALAEYVSQVSVAGNQITDNPGDIVGDVNGVNKIFTLRYNYVVNSTKVYVNGSRLSLGVDYDYIEVAPNKIQLTIAPESDSNIVVDYVKT